MRTSASVPKTSPKRKVDDLDDDDIDERIRQLEDEELKTRPTLSSIARSASVQDLADMIVELIESHSARHHLTSLVVEKLREKNLLAR